MDREYTSIRERRKSHEKLSHLDLPLPDGTADDEYLRWGPTFRIQKRVEDAAKCFCLTHLTLVPAGC